MPSTAVCSLTPERDTGTNFYVVKQAVEYILAQPDGKTYFNFTVTNAEANAFFQRTECLDQGTARYEGQWLRNWVVGFIRRCLIYSTACKITRLEWHLMQFPYDTDAVHFPASRFLC
jgi:hypothetical protein